ncbi:MAG: TonB-dependent receptor [Deltaproteobacteria bacterium]|nr:TonB-dependent receptor [Deltaproteobacteria bacterium]
MFLLLLTLLSHAKATEIALLHRPPKTIAAARPFIVRGQMVGASEVEHAEIRFRRAGQSAFDKVELELKEGEDYEGVVPAEEIEAGALEYYVLAFDFLGKAKEVFASAKRPQRVLVEGASDTTQPPDTPPSEPWRDPKKPPPPELPPDPKVKPANAAPPAEGPDRLIFDAADLATLSVTNIAELLERVADVAVSRGSDGRFHVARAGMRDDAGVLVTLDGQPLTSLGSGAPDLRIPTSTLARVEIVQASAHATDLEGTVLTIHLHSRHAQVALRALGGGYLSHLTSEPSKTVGTYEGAIVGGGGTDRLNAFARAYGHYSNGAQLLVPADALSSTGPSFAPGLTNDRALRIQGGLTLEVKLTKDHTLTVDADYLRFDHGAFIGAYDLFGPEAGREANHARLIASLKGALGILAYRAAVGYRLAAGAFTTQVVPPDYTTPDRNGDNVSERFTDGVLDRFAFLEHAIDVDAGISATFGWQDFSARTVFAQYLAPGARFERSATLGGLPADLGANDLPQPTALSRSHVMLGVSDVMKPVPWVEIDLGARFTVMTDVGLTSGDLPALLSPVGGVLFKPAPGLRLRLSYDTTARGPTLVERFTPPPFDGRGVAGNASNRFASVRTAAFDASYAAGGDAVRYRIDLRAFYSGARGNVIALNESGAGDVWSDAQAIDTAGVGAFGRIGFLTHSSVRAGLSWHRAFASLRAIAGQSFVTDTPQVSAVLQATIEISSWADLMLGATFYGERKNNARTPNERQRGFAIPAQAVLQAEVRSRPFSGVRFIALASNALDGGRFDDALRPDALTGLVPREGLRLLGGIEFSLEEMRAAAAPAKEATP